MCVKMSRKTDILTLPQYNASISQSNYTLSESGMRVKLAYGQFAGCPEVLGSCWYIFIRSLGLWLEIWFTWVYAYYSRSHCILLGQLLKQTQMSDSYSHAYMSVCLCIWLALQFYYADKVSFRKIQTKYVISVLTSTGLKNSPSCNKNKTKICLLFHT